LRAPFLKYESVAPLLTKASVDQSRNITGAIDNVEYAFIKAQQQALHKQQLHYGQYQNSQNALNSSQYVNASHILNQIGANQ
jgi:hypothetical protein